ncbi:hypothetical protein PRIC1_000473 [Phytophthora ramorum]|uniref:uncharacterized protein n=1 Tax=Phytophthora ramorum TaxID=164328 RepID=UPI0030AE6583|nr:hypothetical protein KRP23_7148 [Phytophthora ramorum]KAH7498133.1 hypothetical protein KRP22_12250 [Phytophthora ramorum]
MLVTDSAGQPVVELECMPKMMMLRTLAEPTDPNQEAYDPLYFTPTSGSVMVMPRLGEGWLVSHYGNTPVS